MSSGHATPALPVSIKPVACADNGILNWYADSYIHEEVGLYAIPDTHRIVPVELLERLLQENYLYPDESDACVELVTIIGGKQIMLHNQQEINDGRVTSKA